MAGQGDQLRTDPARIRLERLERLQGLTAALSAAATPDEVARLIFEQGLSLVGARAVNLFWEVAPGALELVHGLGLSEEFVQRYRRLAPDARLPSATAYRTGAPVWLGDREAILAQFPEVASLLEREGDQAWAAIPLVAGRSRGALGLRFETPRAFDVEEQAFVVAVARQCAQALERAQLFEAQKRLAARLQSLQATTSALSAALTPREVAAVVLRALLGLGAHEGAIYELAVPALLERLTAHGSDPAAPDRPERVPIDAALPQADAARSGEPRWLESPEAIRAAYPELEPERARRGDAAWSAVPLRLDGRTVGVVALSFPPGRSLEDEDRSLVLALAQQCAQALERARLYDTQRRLAERLRQIQSTAAALSGAATPRGVADAAFRGLAALGASSAEIHALERPDRLVLVARHGPPLALDPAPIALEAPAPAAEVVRTGKAVWIESPDEIAGRYPDLEEATAGGAGGAWAVVPLLAGGNTLGALSIAFPEPRPFESDEKAFVRMLAIPCAQALERAQMFEAASRDRADAEWNAATLDAMLSGAPIGLALLDREGRFQRVNGVIAQLTGIPPDAHAGRALAELLPARAAEQLSAALARAVETGARVELVLVGEAGAAPAGARRWLASCYPVRVGSETVGMGVLLREAPAP